MTDTLERAPLALDLSTSIPSRRVIRTISTTRCDRQIPCIATDYRIESAPEQLASNLVWGVKALRVRLQ